METNRINKKEIRKKLRVEIVRGLGSIARLGRDWDDLFKRADKASPFFSRAWVQTFILEENIKGTPLLITVWSQSRLVALLPLAIRSYCGIKVAAVVPTTILCYTGVLIDSNYREAVRVVAEAFVQEKIAHVLYNKYTSSDDESTNKLFKELCHLRLSCRRWHRHVCLWTRLEPTFEMALKGRRTRKQRLDLLYNERRVFKSGNVRVTRYIGKQITPEITKCIADIQDNSWVKAQGAAFLGQPFYQKLLVQMGQADIGCVWLMTKDDDDVAFLYALRVDMSLYLKWMAYKLKYGSSSLSFGKTMYMQVIRYACDEGISLVDFGFGEDKWKKLWAINRQNVDRVVCGRGLIGQVAVVCCGLLRICGRYRWLLHNRFQKMRKNWKQKVKSS